jgi:hypothetical protein
MTAPHPSPLPCGEREGVRGLRFLGLIIEVICNLACLREAASAKAGAWNLMLFKLTMFLSIGETPSSSLSRRGDESRVF